MFCRIAVAAHGSDRLTAGRHVRAARAPRRRRSGYRDHRASTGRADWEGREDRRAPPIALDPHTLSLLAGHRARCATLCELLGASRAGSSSTTPRTAVPPTWSAPGSPRSVDVGAVPASLQRRLTPCVDETSCHCSGCRGHGRRRLRSALVRAVRTVRYPERGGGQTRRCGEIDKLGRGQGYSAVVRLHL